jgi:hypothetical protein
MNRPLTSWEVGEQSASKPLRPFGSASVRHPVAEALDDPGRQSCPDCGFIWEACECDLAPYRSAFETKGRLA